MAHIMRQCDEDPEKGCALHANTSTPWINPVKRVGQPRKNWAIETMTEMLDKLHTQGGALHGLDVGEEMDVYDENKVQTLNLAAHLYVVGE